MDKKQSLPSSAVTGLLGKSGRRCHSRNGAGIPMPPPDHAPRWLAPRASHEPGDVLDHLVQSHVRRVEDVSARRGPKGRVLAGLVTLVAEALLRQHGGLVEP